MDNQYKKYLDDGIDKLNHGEYELACDLINKSIKLNSNWEISYFYRAIIKQIQNKLDEAILDYTKAIKINPKMVDAYYNRAKILFDKRDENINLDLVYQDLKVALELDNNFIDALFLMAALEKKRENYKLSLEYLDKILILEPEAVQARAFKKLLLQKYIKE